MRAIFQKELRSYFRSPRSYIFIAAFLFISGIYFSKSLLTPEETSFADAFSDMGILAIFFVPILTMCSLTTERAYRTDRILLTGYPSCLSVIFGKFLAAYCIYFATATLSFLYPTVIVLVYGQCFSEILLLYIGFLLFGMALLSFGIFVSSLSRHPVRAALVTVAGLLVFWMVGNALPNIENSALLEILSAISLFTHFDEFSFGLLGFSSILYMLSFGAIFLLLSAKMVSLWRQGKT